MVCGVCIPKKASMIWVIASKATVFFRCFIGLGSMDMDFRSFWKKRVSFVQQKKRANFPLSEIMVHMSFVWIFFWDFFGQLFDDAFGDVQGDHI